MQTENQYLQRGFGFLSDILTLAQGKYIAFCEGDDYWTDPNKLQKQVDFLEGHSEYSLCFCQSVVVYEDPAKKSHLGYLNEEMPEGYLKPIAVPEETTDINRLAIGNYIHTPGVLFCNWIKDHGVPEYMKTVSIGDWPLHLRTAMFGKIRYFPEPMVVYRVHDKGVWSTQSRVNKQRMALLQYPPLLGSPLLPDSLKAIWQKQLPYWIANFEKQFSHCEETKTVVAEVRQLLIEVWPSFASKLECARK
jgi:hypothetical protein